MVQADDRLEGLDLARYAAFVGMVFVNFRISMGAEGGSGLADLLVSSLEGRAAAVFVVVAGIGLGLSGIRGENRARAVTLRRAVFLLVVGLLNMTVFDADIIHYYAFYFLFGALLLPFGNVTLAGIVAGLNALFVAMILVLDYDTGWDWASYSYSGFWTLEGFARNLFFNGWHPVIPWLGFLLFGIMLGRLPLAERATQVRLVLGGAAALALAELAGGSLAGHLALIDPGLAVFATTNPIPPMPLYTLAGMGASSVVVGACLLAAGPLGRIGVMGLLGPAGRQTLTLYIAHILVGMGTLEALGMLGGQSPGRAAAASLLFCLAATVYAFVWSRFFRRGPAEVAMRRIAG